MIQHQSRYIFFTISASCKPIFFALFSFNMRVQTWWPYESQRTAVTFRQRDLRSTCASRSNTDVGSLAQEFPQTYPYSFDSGALSAGAVSASCDLKLILINPPRHAGSLSEIDGAVTFRQRDLHSACTSLSNSDVGSLAQEFLQTYKYPFDSDTTSIGTVSTGSGLEIDYNQSTATCRICVGDKIWISKK
jgi:hypothetical protein